MKPFFSRGGPFMPNFRTVEYRAGAGMIRIVASPLDWRRRRLWRWHVLYWVPYLSGSEVGLHLEQTPATDAREVRDELSIRSNIHLHDAMTTIESSPTFRVPLTRNTPIEYVSAPGEYRYELVIGGESQTVADFSAMSKDRTVFGILLAMIAVGGSIGGSLLVNMLT